jgi:hypothetical protein|tara:strand:- start:5804 stop:6247 length:444 start_codon:yes stop_codon:yes gene_type:complete
MSKFEQFKKDFTDWMIDQLEVNKEDGYPTCPYARTARVQDKLQFIDCSGSNPDAMLEFDPRVKMVGVCWFGDDVDLDTINLEQMKELNPDLMYLQSTKTSGHFVQNISNVILIQIRSELLRRRASLHKSSYYDSWPAEYYKEIMLDQ